MDAELYRILYVDDDAESCNVIKEWLTSHDSHYDVTTVETAEEALHLVEARDFDLLVLDYCLPGMSGAQFCRSIKAKNRRTPVLIYSALDRPIDRENASRAGADLYLVKPDDIDELYPSVERLLAASVGGRRVAQRSRFRRARGIF